HRCSRRCMPVPPPAADARRRTEPERRGSRRVAPEACRPNGNATQPLAPPPARRRSTPRWPGWWGCSRVVLGEVDLRGRAVVADEPGDLAGAPEPDDEPLDAPAEGALQVGCHVDP